MLVGRPVVCCVCCVCCVHVYSFASFSIIYLLAESTMSNRNPVHTILWYECVCCGTTCVSARTSVRFWYGQKCRKWNDRAHANVTRILNLCWTNIFYCEFWHNGSSLYSRRLAHSKFVSLPIFTCWTVNIQANIRTHSTKQISWSFGMWYRWYLYYFYYILAFWHWVE